MIVGLIIIVILAGGLKDLLSPDQLVMWSMTALSIVLTATYGGIVVFVAGGIWSLFRRRRAGCK